MSGWLRRKAYAVVDVTEKRARPPDEAYRVRGTSCATLEVDQDRSHFVTFVNRLRASIFPNQRSMGFEQVKAQPRRSKSAAPPAKSTALGCVVNFLPYVGWFQDGQR